MLLIESKVIQASATVLLDDQVNAAGKAIVPVISPHLMQAKYPWHGDRAGCNIDYLRSVKLGPRFLVGEYYSSSNQHSLQQSNYPSCVSRAYRKLEGCIRPRADFVDFRQLVIMSVHSTLASNIFGSPTLYLMSLPGFQCIVRTSMILAEVN